MDQPKSDQLESGNQNIENGDTISKKTIRSIFWRSLFLQVSWNYERLQALGYAFAFKPVIEKLYKTKEERALAAKRHLEFFNTNPAVVGPILGMNAAMEEKRSSDGRGVSGIKVGLMGPLAGLGDSILFLTWMPIVMSIGAAFAKDGNILGPILAFVLFNVVNIPVRYYGVKLGYEKGANFLTDAKSTGTVKRYTEMATILGIIVVGGLVPQLVKLTTPYQLKVDETTIKFQEIFDKILPSLLPLTVTLISYLLLKKGVGPVKILFGIIVISVLGKWAGVL